MSMTTGPCAICGAEVRLVTKVSPRRLGDATASTFHARICTSATCPSNTGTRRLGDVV